ncbi:flagellar basal-body MS-ring/collar protein FliF [Methylobacterium nodulans]|uniref:Flagellar M-ring protein n=1 Tax=Methylobacterium nodulans (strain LMG 21967 / CNCM I-2342 / ORS 2060) TaxID=460265 RepID=B8IU24_METNO|nr:flagellar basal-body MS-ring/collar protein FliF [Methylobacterium nodulans]ACL60882.1 flagellar M-ring protein FliF [Methylobacterium nodulans ORS 2060]
MKPVLDLVAKFGPARLAAMGAVTLTLVGFFAFVILRVSRPEMGVLYADLSMQDASAVIRDLDARGLRYETRGEMGQTILAPRADLARLRMDLAGKGLPSAGGVGYEIFDKGDAFSSTTFVQNVNHLRALEGELARSIRAIGRVQAARIHLVIPEKRLFARDREPPSAAIVLKLSGDLDPGQVRAVRHLVASSVEGLKPDRISIVDERGRLLADGAKPEDAQGRLGLDERQANLEHRLRAQVEGIVAGIVGSGRARVQVAAELDANRIESRSETFDPESRVVRSTQTRSETQQSQGPGETGVSVGNELPGARDPAQQNGTREASNKNEETTNYEISRVTRTEINEGGRIRRLSVAVVIDGTYTPGPDGRPVYAPRPQDELDRITALVRTAVGYDKARGDQIEVVNLRFAEGPVPAEIPEEGLLASFKPTKEDVLRLAELGVLALLTLVVVLAVVRPLLRRVIAVDAPPAELVAAGIPVLPGALPGAAPAEDAPPPDSPAKHLVDFARINGKLQAETIERVADIVRQNPAETAEVLRNWINDR